MIPFSSSPARPFSLLPPLLFFPRDRGGQGKDPLLWHKAKGAGMNRKDKRVVPTISLCLCVRAFARACVRVTLAESEREIERGRRAENKSLWKQKRDVTAVIYCRLEQERVVIRVRPHLVECSWSDFTKTRAGPAAAALTRPCARSLCLSLFLRTSSC